MKLKARDFESDQEVRWCPGCGDYAILKQVQAAVAETGTPKEDVVFISGIGCSSRFPYYMDTFGMHGIHGRATAISSGLKIARPDLSVWIITGDGDSLSIGGNHLIHLLRRNIDTNILLFNNEIYGLTKGQYSPTSQEGLKTKTSPMGVIDHPFNPAALAFGARATFIARVIDRDPRHLKTVLVEADAHKGTSFVEIYQNCPVFNDGVFQAYSERGLKDEHVVMLEEGKPLIFAKGQKGLRLEGSKAVVVDIESEGDDNLWIHDPSDRLKAFALTEMFDDLADSEGIPRPFGVFYREERPTYEDMLAKQMQEAEGYSELDDLLRGPNPYVVV